MVIGRLRITCTGNQIGKRGAIGTDLDAVAGDRAAAGILGGRPREINLRLPVRRSLQTRRRIRHRRRGPRGRARHVGRQALALAVNRPHPVVTRHIRGQARIAVAGRGLAGNDGTPSAHPIIGALNLIARHRRTPVVGRRTPR